MFVAHVGPGPEQDPDDIRWPAAAAAIRALASPASRASTCVPVRRRLRTLAASPLRATSTSSRPSSVRAAVESGQGDEASGTQSRRAVLFIAIGAQAIVTNRESRYGDVARCELPRRPREARCGGGGRLAVRVSLLALARRFDRSGGAG